MSLCVRERSARTGAWGRGGSSSRSNAFDAPEAWSLLSASKRPWGIYFTSSTRSLGGSLAKLAPDTPFLQLFIGVGGLLREADAIAQPKGLRHQVERMAPFSLLHRYRGLDGRQRRLLVEALARIALASAAIRLLPFRRVVRLAQSKPLLRKPPEWGPDATVRQVGWSVRTAARMVPWRAVCFQKGLALHLMLRQRGIPSVLHYGVRRDGEGAMAAHVWVCREGRAVIGGEEAPRFTCVAAYPSGG